MHIKKYGTIKLNSFRPLCSTKLGLEAIKKYNFPPFIDASCRREPDFQNSYPSISSLCRQGKFAPHLRINDIIVYMTVGDLYLPYKLGHHLVAILQVEDVFKTHHEGAIAYHKEGLEMPSNCMVPDNYPLDFDKTAGNFKNNSQLNTFLSHSEKQKLIIGKARIKLWNEDYLRNSKTWQCFVKTKPLYLNINDPRQILRSEFIDIFGKLPNTRTPNKITEKQLIDLAKIVGLELLLGGI